MPKAAVIYALLKSQLKMVADEMLWVLALADACELLRIWKIDGGDVEDVIDLPRAAVRLRGAGLITVHQHPAASPATIDHDCQFVARTKDASDALGVVYWNHLVVSYGIYAAFAERGWL